jgi:PEP-CTERM motif
MKTRANSVMCWAFLACLVLGSLAAGSARATSSNETITFIDSPEGTFRVDQSGASRFSCPSSASDPSVLQCSLTAPTAATFQSSTLPNGNLYTIGEPGPTLGLISDYFQLCFAGSRCTTTDTTLPLFFTSNPEGLNQFCFGPCTTIEDGTVQTAGTVTWSDGTVDTIKFQSDVNEAPPAVPEPGTLLLFGSGLISIVGFARRKLFTR